MTLRTVSLAVAVSFAALAVCGRAKARSANQPSPRGEANSARSQAKTYVFAPDPEPNRVTNLIFTTIPPDYLADRAAFFAENGVYGVMMDGIMSGLSVDVWKQPTRFTPGGEQRRVVGEDNPLFRACKRMNERCRAAGVRYNSIKVAFSHAIPDWFDEAGWAALCERFRQGAIFARDAGFSGMALDVEYIYRMYELTYEAYQAPGYPRDRLVEQARRRGYELVSAMLREFPDMILWELPETPWTYGPVGVSMFVGMVDALAEVDAPGGMHLCTENTYGVTDPARVLANVWAVDMAARKAMSRRADERALAYWMRRCEVSPGLWPLGYYRTIRDSTGKMLGYSGRKEVFGNRIVGSYADKSPNYSVEKFREQFGAARLLARRFTWIYGHGPVLWRMTPEEKDRYHGAWNDTLPAADNLDEYLAVMREKRVIGNPDFVRRATAVREGTALAYPGMPPKWWHIGPFPCRSVDEFRFAYPPEVNGFDARASYPAYPGYDAAGGRLRWRPAALDFTGFVDLKEIVAQRDSASAYSVAWFEIAAPDTLVPDTLYIRFGSNDFASVFINGRRVHDWLRGRYAVMDADVFPVAVPAGRSEIMVKCGNKRRAWGFYLRVTDENGDEVSGLRWVGAPGE